MRFTVGAIILFAASFGAVFYFSNSADDPQMRNVGAILKNQPAAYSQIYEAFQTIDSDGVGELDRSLIAFAEHKNEPALRQDLNGLMLRAIPEGSENLKNAGRTRLESITRRTLDLIRGYLVYGTDFCDATIVGDFGSAGKFLHANREKKDADKILDDLKQERFEIAALTIDAIAAGKREPLAAPRFDEEQLDTALVAAADKEQARLLEALGNGTKSCREREALLAAALNIADDDMRHYAIATLSGGQ